MSSLSANGQGARKVKATYFIRENIIIVILKKVFEDSAIEPDIVTPWNTVTVTQIRSTRSFSLEYVCGSIADQDIDASPEIGGYSDLAWFGL
ncbi:hypothetical protein CDAR_9951 [Caerostris darwini]|uniref:Uncharacterized protein n=1 Tax=Caerostris darwini TaxID=1538125 RepID=A0AAV4QYT6_9ARAC|nr:hypothetical protein CDAR_9951 [Caerostris darwini]